MATEKAVLEFDLSSLDGRNEYDTARQAFQYKAALFKITAEIKALASVNDLFLPLLDKVDRIAHQHSLLKIRDLIRGSHDKAS